MRLTRRRILSGTAALGLARLTSACSSATAGARIVEFWGLGREGEVVPELLPQFERENPDVRVRVQQLPFSAAHEKLLTAFAGGSLPDIGQIGNTWLPELQALNAVQRLDARVSASTGVRQDDYFPGIWNTNLVDGGLYGVPWYVDTRLLFYRRDLLRQAGYDAPPTTWAGWAEAMTAIKRRSDAAGGGERYGVYLPLNEYEPLLALAMQGDDPLLRLEEGRGNFRSAGFKQALTYYKSLFDRGLAPAADNTQIANLFDEFDRGYFAFYITGPWNIGEFKRRLPAARQDDWMTAPLPGPDGPGAGLAGGSSLVVFNSSDVKPEAWRLLEYLSRPEVQVRFHALTGNLPARRSAWTAPSLASDIHARAFRDQLERVRPTPQTPEWERIAQELRIVGEEVVRKGLSVDAAAAKMDARADRYLEKRRWLIAREREARVRAPSA